MNKIRLTRCYYTAHRKEFLLEEDVYEGWVILAVESGRFQFSLEEETAVLKEPVYNEAGFGDLVICPPHVVLTRKVLEPVSFHFIEFTMDGEYAKGKVLIRDFQRLSSTFSYLRQIADDPLEDHHEFANHLINDLLLVSAREQKLAEQQSQDKQDPLTVHAMAYLNQHAFGAKLSMQLLAEKLGISNSQLSRRFQAAYRYSPIEYVTLLRLQRARSLLIDTDHTIDHIAEQCGYQNGFYLSRIFTAKLKISPSAYRRTYRF